MEGWLRDIKEATPCDDCQEHFPHFVMDFDHVRGEKLDNVSGFRRRMKWEAMAAEIEKCDIVCARCHRIRTHRNPQASAASAVTVLKRVIVCEIIKRMSPCTDCDRYFPSQAMDFDHVRGEKLHEISTLMRNRSPIEKLLTELDKCDLVCVNCHRIRTYERFYPDDVARWRADMSSMALTTA
jgi:hypothetical protein